MSAFDSVKIKQYKSKDGEWDILMLDNVQVAMSKADEPSSSSVHSICRLMKRAYDTGEQLLPVRWPDGVK